MDYQQPQQPVIAQSISVELDFNKYGESDNSFNPSSGGTNRLSRQNGSDIKTRDDLINFVNSRMKEGQIPLSVAAEVYNVSEKKIKKNLEASKVVNYDDGITWMEFWKASGYWLSESNRTSRVKHILTIANLIIGK